MSRHEGVSCDACLKGNFRGRRFKCLICYDYDLCASCYESGATTTRHTTEHPMQCILTRVDYDLYYGGDTFSVEQPQSFTCPYCGKMGYTETSLQEHVTSEHAETSTEVICPICAALPGGDPNHVTDDFTAHLTLEHRAPRDLISFLYFCARLSLRIAAFQGQMSPGRFPRPVQQRAACPQDVPPRKRAGGGHEHDGQICTLLAAPRGGCHPRRHRAPPTPPATERPWTPSQSCCPSCQACGVRRGGQINSSGPSASQLQQLQMQLQLERQQAQAARQQVETGRHATRRGNNPGNPGTAIPPPNTNSSNSAAAGGESNPSSNHSSQFLLARLNEPKMSEAERQFLEGERADRSLFVQELLLSTLMHEESSSSDEDERRDFASFGAMGCVDIMPLDVALENLQLRESSFSGKEPPPPPPL
ncbi:hypothetical protein CgunFtcFv8_025369 [Champsocephalus gunnari]|uniref:E3 ubiquitin-protein ligase KCMF1 n=1 Tax=Champsocephalus gunnari TaxID=52237 RepID=A0AAN8H223_CHAGU|nr:hypothetical protein CgunFtcFv8_025369 [Champsocephalus gunnari]